MANGFQEGKQLIKTVSKRSFVLSVGVPFFSWPWHGETTPRQEQILLEMSSLTDHRKRQEQATKSAIGGIWWDLAE